MKKFLTFLFGLMLLQSAYSDDSILESKDLTSQISDYLNNKMDENAIRALCERILTYAWMHHFQVSIELKDNTIFQPTGSDCKKYKDMQIVSGILEAAVMQLSEKTFEKHSQCTQKAMERNAFTSCKNLKSAEVTLLQRQGYKFDFTQSNTIIDCSETDDRCVVNRPAKKDGKNGYYSICCGVPVYSCDESSGSYNAQVSINEISAELTSSARTLKDFDYACQPIK